ncbi:hypothetical protein [Rubritalea halochordaticola]
MSCQQEKEQAAELQGNSATETSLRKVWLSAAIGMLAEKMDKGEVKEEQITGVIVEAVAAEASYSYAGENIDIENSLQTLGRLYAQGLISETQLKDPLKHAEYFKQHPDTPSPTYHTHPKVLESSESYRKFCAWFVESVTKAQ